MERFRKSKFPKLYIRDVFVNTYKDLIQFNSDSDLKIPTFLIYFTFVLKSESLSIDRLISIFKKRCMKSYIVSLKNRNLKKITSDFNNLLRSIRIRVDANSISVLIKNLYDIILNNYEQPMFHVSAKRNISDDYVDKIASTTKMFNELNNIQNIIKELLPCKTNSLIILLNNLLIPIKN